MSQQLINIGTNPNDGTGDALRDAMIKVNENFSELYTGTTVNNTITVGNSSVNATINSTSMTFTNTGSRVFVGNATVNSVVNNYGFYTSGNVSCSNLSITTNNFTLGVAAAGANGYTILPNGFKMQWGQVSANSTDGNAVFASAWGTAMYSVSVTTDSPAIIAGVTGSNSTHLLIRTDNTTSNTVYYMAIGR